MVLTRLAMVGVAAALVLGCGAPVNIEPGIDSYSVLGPDKKVVVDAYLYDARLHREGKPTSFRLQLFQNDTEIAMSGRGYLGKGAIKGRLSRDTLLAYFPSTNEYIYEATSELFTSANCPDGVPAPRLQELLTTLPDGMLLPGAEIITVEEKKKKRSFSIDWIDCPWRMELDYDLRDEGWRLKRLDFEAGDDTRFTLKRRVFKPHTKVKRSKMTFRVPDGAVRVSP